MDPSAPMREKMINDYRGVRILLADAVDRRQIPGIDQTTHGLTCFGGTLPHGGHSGPVEPGVPTANRGRNTKGGHVFGK